MLDVDGYKERFDVKNTHTTIIRDVIGTVYIAIFIVSKVCCVGPTGCQTPETRAIYSGPCSRGVATYVVPKYGTLSNWFYPQYTRFMPDVFFPGRHLQSIATYIILSRECGNSVGPFAVPRSTRG